ncbi:MAG: hypothetical protein KBT68_11360 [bacterium]|nr:hypothetical protein [Candidatus Colisoma equi]
MIGDFLPADYALCGITIVMAVLGLFRGFSGTLGFVLGAIAAAFAASFGWAYSTSLTEVVWQRGAGVLVVTLLAFGVVRLIVKKLVNGLLAQPSDAIFGCLIGAALGVLLLVAWAYSGAYFEYSTLAKEMSSYVR